MKIGVIGAGAIANYLLKELYDKTANHMEICSLFVRDEKKYRELEAQYQVTLYEDLDMFLDSGIDVVVEAANVQAVQTLVPSVIQKKDVIVISIGAFADADFYDEMYALAMHHHKKIHLPSGAIGGLDLIQNAHVTGGIKHISLTTRKPAKTLTNKKMTEAETIFTGSASEAIRQFPKNINVSIVLSIAGIGVEETEVNIVADPTIENNIHTIDIQGEFGEASFTIRNNPFPENPKTSHLAAMSVLGTLKRMSSIIKIGG